MVAEGNGKNCCRASWARTLLVVRLCSPTSLMIWCTASSSYGDLLSGGDGCWTAWGFARRLYSWLEMPSSAVICARVIAFRPELFQVACRSCFTQTLFSAALASRLRY